MRPSQPLLAMLRAAEVPAIDCEHIDEPPDGNATLVIPAPVLRCRENSNPPRRPPHMEDPMNPNPRPADHTAQEPRKPTSKQTKAPPQRPLPGFKGSQRSPQGDAPILQRGRAFPSSHHPTFSYKVNIQSRGILQKTTRFLQRHCFIPPGRNNVAPPPYGRGSARNPQLGASAGLRPRTSPLGWGPKSSHAPGGAS